MNLKRVALIGFMGSGKTTIGLFLSKELSYPFIDLDDYIEENSFGSILSLANIKLHMKS